jgi:hypothetical protein
MMVHFVPPDSLRLERDELRRLFTECDALPTHVYIVLLVLAGASGQVDTTYAALIARCTPPQPERGPRRPGPSHDRMRRAVDQLERAGLVERDRGANASQGRLRLRIPRHRQ